MCSDRFVELDLAFRRAVPVCFSPVDAIAELSGYRGFTECHISLLAILELK